MMDRRGFRYPLAPLQKMTQWDANNLRQELARLAAEERKRHAVVSQSEQAYQMATVAVREQSMAGVLDAARHSLWLRHLDQLDGVLAQANKALAEVSSRKQEVVDLLAERHRYLKGLEAHRAELLQQFAKEQSAKEAVQLDETWLVANRNKGN
ncbi:hypothetical protein [Chitinimonas sp. JJ19]|uniref:hypothetical protein n=1 Tax=Chitinimonas sp. JJ19 TaxID=3109352 RepID=UPI003003A33D